MTAETVIDESRLRELEDDFGAEDVAMVIEAFLEESGEVVDAIGEILSDEPNQQRVDHFHFLSGAAQNLGAQRFGELCRKFETANGPFTEAEYGPFQAEFGAVKDYFAARFGESAA